MVGSSTAVARRGSGASSPQYQKRGSAAESSNIAALATAASAAIVTVLPAVVGRAIAERGCAGREGPLLAFAAIPLRDCGQECLGLRSRLRLASRNGSPSDRS